MAQSTEFANSILNTVHSEADKQLLDNVAHTWVEHGGDAEGVFWLWHILQQRIKELTDGDV